jgi:solute:Na+ symporter, SSS family
MSAWITVGVPLVIYLGVCLGIGAVASKVAGRSPEEYFLAGRHLGPFVLFMALFGTNITAFLLVGIPGRAYHDGIGIFGVNAPLCALGIPLVFWAIGSPARKMAKRVGALTPAELFRERFGSSAVGVVLFLFYVLYTLPYMVTGVKGAAITLKGVAGVPEWVGGLLVLAITLGYTVLGGMLATAWTNVVQGAFFIVYLVVALFMMSSSLGGFEAASEAVRAHDPNLLVIAGQSPLFTPGGWVSWSLAICLTVVGFPHMLVRLMAGRDERALKTVSAVYPIAMLMIWLPAVMIGVWGAAAFPGLEGQASDRIFSMMSAKHMPPFIGALGFIAVLSAVMSTLDAQILTLSSMLVRDVLDRMGSWKVSEVIAGRAFNALVAGLVYVLALSIGSSIFDIATFAFSGYVMLTPTLLFGLRWRRFNATGAIASILIGNAVLLLGMAKVFPLFGFLPVFFGLIAAIAAAIIGAYLGAPTPVSTVERAFGSS